ncbi:hypothetical protein [Flavobacterium selenitireducens]|uniref:hypothetical protein n=1 Tax=Flavobacterium selenitireducens TaxID=2722704 RepID=UPI00168A6AA4|nr:hypothetical protein [Flavobacterium selenitireducens]MBD3582860.1 hypothetical protein [Flavobacterium selenitireducens]
MKHFRSNWNLGFYGLSVIPILYTVLSCFLYFNAYLLLGHFPKPSLNDPGTFALPEYLGKVALLSLFCLPYSFVAWLLLSAAYLYRHRKPLNVVALVFSLTAYAIAAGIVFSNVTEWLLD